MKFCRPSLLLFLLFTSAANLWGQSNPIPTINGPVAPQAVIPGSAAFTLTVRGAGFVPGAAVNWNGTARNTTFVSAGELQAQILASDVAAPGGALVTVTNPPPGGGFSSSSFAVVEIHQPVATVMLSQSHTYPGSQGGFRLFTADFTGDSKQDLIQLGEGFTILVGNGDGTFTRSASLPLQTQPEGISFGDFNGDGKEDFALAIYDRGLAFVALGDGTGKFHTLRGFGNFSKPVQTATGDFNRDGKLDLVVAASDGVYVLLGNGDGTFQPQQSAASIFMPDGLVPADFNGDGILDLAFVDGGTGLIAVLLGNGDGTFQPPIETQQGDYVQSVVSDFNGDGKLDFAVVGSGSPVPVGILLGNGDGTFQPPSSIQQDLPVRGRSLSWVTLTRTAGLTFLATARSVFWEAFWQGMAMEPFNRSPVSTCQGPRSKEFAVVGDFNSDGLLDFAISLKNGSEVYLQAPQ